MRITWVKDEIILVADLLSRNGWKALSPNDPSVVELSVALRASALHPAELRDANFRNANGVGRKSSDVATRHPDYRGKPTNGNHLDQEVLMMFLRNVEGMQSEAASIRRLMVSGIDVVIGDDELGGVEGGLLMSVHLRRERKRGLRAKKIDAVRRAGNLVQCDVCDFNFGLVYGDRGVDFVEVHHVLPLHVSGETLTRLADLALLCSNCHRMIHETPWLIPAELKMSLKSSFVFRPQT